MMSDTAEFLCSLCGGKGPFLPFFTGASLRETRCPDCASSRRSRDLVRVLLQECGVNPGRSLASQLALLAPLYIYELQAQGPLHELLKPLPHYICSEYFAGVRPGAAGPGGMLCQDASRLTFASASFDLVISQDVMEHMCDPWCGFVEIQRVLRPGGRHIFTVPLHEERRTRQRARADADGVEHLLPPVFHKDPLNPEGALVFWDYGEDFPDILTEKGIPTRRALHSAFYKPGELCRVNNAEAYERYLSASREKRQAGFFLYNSVIFVAEKPSAPLR